MFCVIRTNFWWYTYMYLQGEVYATQISNKLKGDLRVLLEEADPLAQLEHIDMLQRLGISYHFENEIKSILNEIHSHRFNSLICEKSNLYATALQFRLLRQHGHCVAPGKWFFSPPCTRT